MGSGGLLTILSHEERRLLVAVGKLAYANPFLPERIECEREALGSDYQEDSRSWNVYVSTAEILPNTEAIVERLAALLPRLKAHVSAAPSELNDDDAELYSAAVLFFCYQKYLPRFYDVITSALKGAEPEEIAFFSDFDASVSGYFESKRFQAPEYSPAHLFALAFQLSRAFYNIYYYLVGDSLPMAQLRARVWRSIFSSNLRRYFAGAYRVMGDISTLIVGPSGTGKELIARAIALARYVPFDPKSRRFKTDFAKTFTALNLSAFSSTLIESELFGHKKGSFTGALSDRAGWLSHSGPYGTIFLDEIGELETLIQVKLLRVIESRKFYRIGDSAPHHFSGRIIAATNRDLGGEVREGRFREDFYYRLCADIIETPPLSLRLQASPHELDDLLRFLAQRLFPAGDNRPLVEETREWIIRNLGRSYHWPGNVRELDQCLRNILVQGSYTPLASGTGASALNAEALAQRIASGSIPAEELLNRYCELVYKQTGSYEETGRRIGLDRRTVKSRIATLEKTTPLL